MAVSSRRPTIIIDSGTGCLKAGLSGPDNLPKICKPIVEELTPLAPSTKEKQKISTAIPVASTRDIVRQRKLWKHAFRSLKVDAIEHPVLLTENERNTVKGRETMAEIMFEEFNTPGLYIGNESALSLRWYGRSTGVVVDCGDCLSSVVLFENDRRLADATVLRYGGRNVNVRLESCLLEIASTATRRGLSEAARKLKEAHGYVSMNYHQDLEDAVVEQKSRKVLIEAIIQQNVKVRHELFSCVEGLFQPKLFGSSQDGIVHAVCKAVESQSRQKQIRLFKSVFLCGGSTLCPSFVERFRKDLGKLRKIRADVNVIANENRQYSAWLGGNALACTDTFHDNLLVSKSKYDDEGVFVFEKKQMYSSFSTFVLHGPT